jgi:hypothetical protein
MDSFFQIFILCGFACIVIALISLRKAVDRNASAGWNINEQLKKFSLIGYTDEIEDQLKNIGKQLEDIGGSIENLYVTIDKIEDEIIKQKEGEPLTH